MAFKRSAVRSRLSPPKDLKPIGFRSFAFFQSLLPTVCRAMIMITRGADNAGDLRGDSNEAFETISVAIDCFACRRWTGTYPVVGV